MPDSPGVNFKPFFLSHTIFFCFFSSVQKLVIFTSAERWILKANLITHIPTVIAEWIVIVCTARRATIHIYTDVCQYEHVRWGHQRNKQSYFSLLLFFFNRNKGQTVLTSGVC